MGVSCCDRRGEQSTRQRRVVCHLGEGEAGLRQATWHVWSAILHNMTTDRQRALCEYSIQYSKQPHATSSCHSTHALGDYESWRSEICGQLFLFPGVHLGLKDTGGQKVVGPRYAKRIFLWISKTADKTLCSGSCHNHLVARCHIGNLQKGAVLNTTLHSGVGSSGVSYAWGFLT